jgi:hypothetical protein
VNLYSRGLPEQRILEENADILEARDGKSKKKLFKAIENGDFDDFDSLEAEDPLLATSRECGDLAVSDLFFLNVCFIRTREEEGATVDFG